jgi:hypothetical protein
MYMKNDYEVKLYMTERSKGKSQRVAAARAGMSERTARRYERTGKLPSEMKQPRTWRTRTNPFEQDWPWVVEQLERDPALQAATLFALLCEKFPGRYRPTQDRSLRRHIARWRALHGPDQEVIFQIEYQHLVGSLVRKPGAFAAYRYRDELFPTTTFRLAYDRLRSTQAKHADHDYVRILHLAATTSEAEVGTALQIVLEAGTSPTFLIVRDLVQGPPTPQFPHIQMPTLDLSSYDQLIPSRRTCV